MAAKIDNFQDMPTFITEGIAELTHGIDDTGASEIEELAANPSQLETLLNANGEPSSLDYAAGYIFLRYLAKQVSEGNYTLPAVADDEFIENTVVGATIQTSSGNDTISNSAEKVTINAGDGNDKIYNSGDNVSINGGNGNNVIDNQGPPTIEDGFISWSESNHNVTIETGA